MGRHNGATAKRREKIRARLREMQNNKCCYCGCEMNEIMNHPQCASIERVLPAVFGGEYVYNNCVLACFSCNTSGPDHIELDRTVNMIRSRFGYMDIGRAIKEGMLDLSKYLFFENQNERA
jgi:hypothetical protein